LQDPFNEARTSNFHASLGGYHGAKMRRYQDIISQYLVPEMQQIIQDKRVTESNSNVISMLNTKYLLAGLQANAVVPNPYADGPAWFVEIVKKVNSPDEEIAALGNVNLAETAVIDESKFDIGEIQKDSTAGIELVDYQPNNLIYDASTGTNSLVVFSEIYYPKGWKAYVDGNETEILRVNYILRAIELGPGKHRIEFRFEPNAYYVGNKIMMMSSLILMLIIGYGLFMFWKQTKTAEPQAA
jgi:hypothetical protein